MVVDTVPATAAEATVVTKVVTAAATEETTVASHTEEVKVVVSFSFSWRKALIQSVNDVDSGRLRRRGWRPR